MFDSSLPYLVLAHNYTAAYHWYIFIVVLAAFFYCLHNEIEVSGSSQVKITMGQHILALCVVIPLIGIFSFFPIDWGTYADREAYMMSFHNLEEYTTRNFIWLFILQTIHAFVDNQIVYFAILSMIYVGFRYVACCNFSPTHKFILFLTIASSFLFFSYGYNTIRSGVASSLLLMAFSMFHKDKMSRAVAMVMMFLSYGIHQSMALPACAFLMAQFVKNTKALIVCWGLAFFVSLFVGSVISEFLGDFVAENAYEQAGNYITTVEQSQYNRGFRIDFILYSALPIALGYYYIVRKGVSDAVYIVLFHTYIIANIFFVLVVRANYVDRFGYLSWMLIPLIIMYPLMTTKIFEKQNVVIAFTLLLNVMFTMMMFLR